MFEAGLRPAEGMKCNRGGGFLSWTRAGSWPSEMGVKEGSGFMGISGTFLGRVVLERLLGYSSKSVQGLEGWALSLEEISRMKIKIQAPPSTKR